jgi:hypothetical protein
VASRAGNGALNYEAMSIPGNLHSFAYWPQVKAAALAFLADGFASKTP